MRREIENSSLGREVSVTLSPDGRRLQLNAQTRFRIASRNEMLSVERHTREEGRTTLGAQSSRAHRGVRARRDDEAIGEAVLRDGASRRGVSREVEVPNSPVTGQRTFNRGRRAKCNFAKLAGFYPPRADSISRIALRIIEIATTLRRRNV